jgi:ATP-dependent protease HslVU (ClpYQ) ATPase subunit
MTDFSPREIVSELDRFIIPDQRDTKPAVAIALRNMPNGTALMMVRNA